MTQYTMNAHHLYYISHSAHTLCTHTCALQDWIVLVVGPFSGRLDQEMACYHSAYKW